MKRLLLLLLALETQALPREKIPEIAEQIAQYRAIYAPYVGQALATKIPGLTGIKLKQLYSYAAGLCPKNALIPLEKAWSEAQALYASGMTMAEFKQENCLVAAIWSQDSLPVMANPKGNSKAQELYDFLTSGDRYNRHWWVSENHFVLDGPEDGSDPFTFEAVLYDKNGRFTVEEFCQQLLHKDWALMLSCLPDLGAHGYGGLIATPLTSLWHHFSQIDEMRTALSPTWTEHKPLFQGIHAVGSPLTSVVLFLMLHEYPTAGADESPLNFMGIDVKVPPYLSSMLNHALLRIEIQASYWKKIQMALWRKPRLHPHPSLEDYIINLSVDKVEGGRVTFDHYIFYEGVQATLTPCVFKIEKDSRTGYFQNLLLLSKSLNITSTIPEKAPQDVVQAIQKQLNLLHETWARSNADVLWGVNAQTQFFLPNLKALLRQAGPYKISKKTIGEEQSIVLQRLARDFLKAIEKKEKVESLAI